MLIQRRLRFQFRSWSLEKNVCLHFTSSCQTQCGKMSHSQSNMLYRNMPNKCCSSPFKERPFPTHQNIFPTKCSLFCVHNSGVQLLVAKLKATVFCSIVIFLIHSASLLILCMQTLSLWSYCYVFLGRHEYSKIGLILLHKLHSFRSFIEIGLHLGNNAKGVVSYNSRALRILHDHTT